MLKEKSFLRALHVGETAEALVAGQALRDAIEELSARDQSQLEALVADRRSHDERELLRARLRVLEAWLHSSPVVGEGDSLPDPPLAESGTGVSAKLRRGAHGRLSAAERVLPDGFGHRDDIQGLRAVAVLLVALAHAGVTFLAGGFVGVDVFFVLSGFLITGLLVSEACRRCWVSLTDFYMRRARRILPAATLTLIVTDIAAYQLLNVVRAKQYLQDSIPSALFGANIHFAAIGTDYFAKGQPPSPFQHFWSLAVEEQFYFVWPLLFILLLGLGLRRYAARRPGIYVRDLRRVLAAVIAVSVLSLIWSVHYTAANVAAAYFSTPARAWELGLGAALALALGAFRSAQLPARWRTWMGWTGVACIAVAAVTFSAATPFPGYAALLPTLGAALVIAAGLSGVSGRFSTGRLLALRPLRYIGDRSYAFYLWHWPVLVIVAQAAGHPLSLPVNLLLLLAAFALSVVSYRLYEKPLRFAALTRKPQAALLWVGSVIAVLVLASTWIGVIKTNETRQIAAASATPVPVLALAPVPVPSTPASGPATNASGPATNATESVLPAVMREVRLESAERRLPSVLNPPVTQLLSNLPQLAGSCTAHDGQATSALCRLGVTSSSRTLVIVGDSHAEMWVSDVVQDAQRAGWAVVPVIKTSCQPAEWVGPVGTGECRAWFAWAMRIVRALHPAAAVIAGYYNWVNPPEDQDLSAGLDTAVRAMHRITSDVTIIGDVPQRGQEPVDCLLRSHATATGCSDGLAMKGAALTGLVAQLAETDKAAFIDTTGWFCDNGQCPLVVGNVITYRDISHITQTYAAALSSVFAAALRDTLAAPAKHRG